MRRLQGSRIPDPAKVHGAWVFLLCSVLAGALSAARHGFLPALFAGLSFAGVFFLGSAVAVGRRRGRGRLLIGVAIAVGSPLVAIRLGAPPGFLGYALLAVFPAALAAWAAEKRGFRSPLALAFGVTALAVAAPTAACAGGATAATSFTLLVCLLPLYTWRTVRIRTLLTERGGIDRPTLKRIGRREAVIATVGTIVAVLLVHLIFRAH